jgi:hypothetical protein
VTRKQLPIFHQLGVKFLISSLVTLSGFASVVGAGTLRRGPSDKETTRRRGGPGRRWIPAPAPQSSYCSHVVHRVPWSWVVFCYRSHTRRWLLQARCSTKGPRDHDHDHDLPRQPGMCTEFLAIFGDVALVSIRENCTCYPRVYLNLLIAFALRVWT